MYTDSNINFTAEEINKAVHKLKVVNAASKNEISTEMIKH